MTDLTNDGTVSRVAVITGGASGIGLSVAQHLAAAGHRIAIFDLNGDEAGKAAEDLRAGGTEAMSAEVDVTDRAAIDTALGQVRDAFGPVQILVTSAGIEAQLPFTEITAQGWERMLAVNLTGTFNAAQAVIPDMTAAGWGRIVTISSSSAQGGAPQRAHYVASKGGVIALTKALAYEYSPEGITVNTIPPSIIDTPMAQQGVQNGYIPAISDLAAMTPVRRAGLPDDVGAAAAFLCTEQAGFITGQSIGVNGGWYI